MQIIVVYGLRFERGKWKQWEHTCSAEEIEGVEDSARAKAADYGRPAKPAYRDYLEAVRYIFDVAYGLRDRPSEGDLQVFAVRVDQMILGSFQDVKEYFHQRQDS